MLNEPSEEENIEEEDSEISPEKPVSLTQLTHISGKIVKNKINIENMFENAAKKFVEALMSKKDNLLRNVIRFWNKSPFQIFISCLFY